MHRLALLLLLAPVPASATEACAVYQVQAIEDTPDCLSMSDRGADELQVHNRCAMPVVLGGEACPDCMIELQPGQRWRLDLLQLDREADTLPVRWGANGEQGRALIRVEDTLCDPQVSCSAVESNAPVGAGLLLLLGLRLRRR